MTLSLKSESPVIVPQAALRRAGFTRGQELEVKASGATADDEYTPQQRRVIDAALAKARKGPHYGPFETVEASIAFIEKEIKKRKAARRKTA